ncbi:MAG: excinuclease ABC subunit UvrC [Phycisphaerae bacterium]|nr:excinuclease ABC subunit UvrC [Phycisphaerae bacterium]
MPENRKVILERVREEVAKFPAAPGVYLFMDAAGVVLYVGKAKNLRSRVSSYFQPGANLLQVRGGEIAKLIAKYVDHVEHIECDSEVDALLRENRLIKDIQPRFNERLKDDKSFPYLQITTNEDFPRISITHKPESRGVKLYGPFVRAKDLRKALPMLQRVFKFRTCKLDIVAGDEGVGKFRPCILFNIKQCTAPCGGRVSREDYAAQISRFRKYLDSKGKQLRDELNARMLTASENQNYEQAAELRDELKALQSLQQRGFADEQVQPEVFYIDPTEGLEKLGKLLQLSETPRTIEGIDIAHLGGKETCGAVVCFIDGKPFKSSYRRYKIKTVDGNDDYASIFEVVTRRYRKAGAHEEIFPDVVLIDGGKGQLGAAAAGFEKLGAVPPVLMSLAKKEEIVYVHGCDVPLKIARRNPALRILQSVRDESHRFVQHYHHILRRKATLES